MAWTIRISRQADRALSKVDRRWQQRILDYLDGIAELEDPHLRGEALVGNRAGLWRYRVGDYRVICEIRDHEMIVLVVTIGHRSKVYDKLASPDPTRWRGDRFRRAA